MTDAPDPHLLFPLPLAGEGQGEGPLELPFTTSDALRNERLNGHPKQQSVPAYCGVPMFDEFGIVFGSICHFDTQPRSIPKADVGVRLLEAVSPLLRDGVAGRSSNIGSD